MARKNPVCHAGAEPASVETNSRGGCDIVHAPCRAIRDSIARSGRALPVERFVDYPRGRGLVPEPGMRSMPALQAPRAAAQSRCQGVAVATAGITAVS